MTESLVERAWAWLHETFPERQIYIRSDGRVQFFTFSPTLQATLAGLTIFFLGWVAFSTVNVIFKDRIIAAKDHRYQQMQSAYENRVADLQLSYDELNGALVGAEDKFKQTADELQTKQNTIVKFLDRKRQVDALVSMPAGAVPELGAPISGAKAGGGDSVDTGGGSDADSSDDLIGGGTSLQVMPQPVQPQPRTAKPAQHASLLDFGGVVGRVAGALFGSNKPKPDAADSFARHPALKVLAEQTMRVKHIGDQETILMAQAQNEVAGSAQTVRVLMGNAGINADEFAQKYEASRGMGGPDIPLSAVHVEGISDPAFQDAYLKASAVLTQMDELLGALRHVPLTVPVSGPEFERTSGFGARVDPFTGRYAFHPGLDFAGPWGAIVHSTAAGVVVAAGPHGSYGNMVEIDHGLGIHTRYGHLSAVLVQIGARVGKGASIGKLGSTGRSTGPHVHYEIWYDNVVRNPSKFIEAGHHVL
ncbi:MAG TPA: peptidoglycan DD-metalloendopeptidase family protein [Reyranella sp.]|nr:peptidoglycan DD-metalloendopeptidase family protein [Reyranella sp.]